MIEPIENFEMIDIVGTIEQYFVIEVDFFHGDCSIWLTGYKDLNDPIDDFVKDVSKGGRYNTEKQLNKGINEAKKMYPQAEIRIIEVVKEFSHACRTVELRNTN